MTAFTAGQMDGEVFTLTVDLPAGAAAYIHRKGRGPVTVEVFNNEATHPSRHDTLDDALDWVQFLIRETAGGAP